MKTYFQTLRVIPEHSYSVRLTTYLLASAICAEFVFEIALNPILISAKILACHFLNDENLV